MKSRKSDFLITDIVQSLLETEITFLRHDQLAATHVYKRAVSLWNIEGEGNSMTADKTNV